MVSHFAIPSRKHLGGHAPYAFTEQGVAAVSAVLNSRKATEVSILIMRAFVIMRTTLSNLSPINSRINKIEMKQIETDLKFEKVFNAPEARPNTPAQGIFFEGQIFDAWVFVSELVESAETSVDLWDHYIDAGLM